MAFYEWRCQKCNHEVEIDRPLKDSAVPPDPCEKCGSEDWKKFLSKAPKMSRGANWTGSKGNW